MRRPRPMLSVLRRGPLADRHRLAVVRDLRAVGHAHEHAVDASAHRHDTAERRARRAAVAQPGAAHEHAAPARDPQDPNLAPSSAGVTVPKMRAKCGRRARRTWLSTRTATFSTATGLVTGGLVTVTTRNCVVAPEPEHREREAAAGGRQLGVAEVLEARREGEAVGLQDHLAVGVSGTRERALDRRRAAVRARGSATSRSRATAAPSSSGSVRRRRTPAPRR